MSGGTVKVYVNNLNYMKQYQQDTKHKKNHKSEGLMKIIGAHIYVHFE